MLLQKALSELRELRGEEIDLIGGAFTSESTLQLTYSNAATYCDPHGCHTVQGVDDVKEDIVME